MRFSLSALAESGAGALASPDGASPSKRSSQARHSHLAALGFQTVSEEEQLRQIGFIRESIFASISVISQRHTQDMHHTLKNFELFIFITFNQ